MKRFCSLSLAVSTVAAIAIMWSRGKWATSVPEVAVCSIAFLLAALLALGQKVRTSWVLVPLAGVVALAGTQLLFGITVYPWPTRMAALYWAGNLATVFIGLQFLTDRDARVRYMDILLAFGVFVCIISTAQEITSVSSILGPLPSPTAEYTFGPFLYVNQYAAFVELILPLALFGALTRERGRVLFTLAVALLFGSVLYSGSRGGAGLTVLEMVLVPLVVARRHKLSGRHLLSSGAVLLVALLWVAVAAGPDKLFDKVTKSDPFAFAGRSEFNRASVEMMRARPLQGFGLGNWPTVYPGYATIDDGNFVNQAHNDWAQWTVEGGLPMLILMLLLATWAVPRALRSGWGIGVPVVLIHCLWDYPIQRTGVAIVFFTLLAALEPFGVKEGKQAALPRPPHDS